MELLRRTIDLHHTVVQSTFEAGEHTVLKEVITDESYSAPHHTTPQTRVSYRLHLSPPALARMGTNELLAKTRSYATLSALCAAHGIDPARAAMGLPTVHVSKASAPEPVKEVPQYSPYRHAVRGRQGRFAATTQRQRHA